MRIQELTGEEVQNPTRTIRAAAKILPLIPFLAGATLAGALSGEWVHHSDTALGIPTQSLTEVSADSNGVIYIQPGIITNDGRQWGSLLPTGLGLFHAENVGNFWRSDYEIYPRPKDETPLEHHVDG